MWRPWKRRAREAQEHLEKAALKAREADQLIAESRKITAQYREVVDRNHFGDMIIAAMSGHKPQSGGSHS